MAYYNLRERRASNNLTDFEVSYSRKNLGDDYSLEYHFRIDFYEAYLFSKTLVDKADEFMKELNDLRDTFYDTLYNWVSSGKISCAYSSRLCEEGISPYEKDLKMVYDFFLPLQKDFANKWNLYVNCD